MSDVLYNEEYNTITSYYNHNYKRLEEWLEYTDVKKTSFSNGKQGLVGLFMFKPNPKFKCFFKISQYIDNLVMHEAKVMKNLTELAPYCPYFCKYVGISTCDLDPQYRKKKNPFNPVGASIQKDILLCEFINSKCTFTDVIADKHVSDPIIFSIVKQILLVLIIAQKKKQFTHYDLHSGNIIIKKCPTNLVILYVIDSENQFCIPTYGYFPIIIDFGFSYINEEDFMWMSLAHTDIGFMSDRFDPVADPKLFLVSVSSEIEERRSKSSKLFRRIVRNIFSPLSLDWDSGWDKIFDISASDQANDYLKRFNTCSSLFRDYDHFCVDLIQSLIHLPLKPRSYDNIETVYKTWLHEWVKIENEIQNPFYHIYILKGIIDSTRKVRDKYMNSDPDAVKLFEKEVYYLIDKTCKFCRPKDIHFEKMLCSLLLFSQELEGLLYVIMEKQMDVKKEEYKKMPVSTVDQMFAIIDYNIPDSYVFSEDTNILVLDALLQTNYTFNLDLEKSQKLNQTHNLCRGKELYSLLTAEHS